MKPEARSGLRRLEEHPQLMELVRRQIVDAARRGRDFAGRDLGESLTAGIPVSLSTPGEAPGS